MRQRKTGGGIKVNRKIKYYCGSCTKELGKGSRQKPSIWCNICGWVHFSCSGLQRVDEYKKFLDFLSLFKRCSDTETCRFHSGAYSKKHNVSTSCNNPAAFAGRNALKKASKYSYREVENFLNRIDTYTKFKQTRNRFPRLRHQSFRLNEIWSVDLADKQNLDATTELLPLLS